jgi:hypothetical protein
MNTDAAPAADHLNATQPTENAGVAALDTETKTAETVPLQWKPIRAKHQPHRLPAPLRAQPSPLPRQIPSLKPRQHLAQAQMTLPVHILTLTPESGPMPPILADWPLTGAPQYSVQSLKP